jgi:hypothetical protein
LHIKQQVIELRVGDLDAIGRLCFFCWQVDSL